MKEYERKQLLERIEREGATVGARIPERISVQGDPVDLQEFVFEIKRRGSIPPGERERVERAKRNLRRERIERKQLIEDDEVGYEEGQELVDQIVGIDRALNALEQLEPTSIEETAAAKETADRKRWVTFLKQALGHGDDNPRRGPRP